MLEKGSDLPLEYASVSFLDSSGKIVTGGITDVNGEYDVKVPEGTYTIQFDFISFKTRRLTGQVIDNNIKLPLFYFNHRS